MISASVSSNVELGPNFIQIVRISFLSNVLPLKLVVEGVVLTGGVELMAKVAVGSDYEWDLSPTDCGFATYHARERTRRE